MTTISPALDERVIPVPAMAGISSGAALVAVWAAAAAVPAGGVFPVGCLAAMQAAVDSGTEWRLTGMGILAAGEAAASAVDAEADGTCRRPYPSTLAYGLGSSEATIAGQAVVVRGAGSAPVREAAARAALRWLQGERELPLWETVRAATEGTARLRADDTEADDTDDAESPAERRGPFGYEDAAE